MIEGDDDEDAAEAAAVTSWDAATAVVAGAAAPAPDDEDPRKEASGRVERRKFGGVHFESGPGGMPDSGGGSKQEASQVTGRVKIQGVWLLGLWCNREFWDQEKYPD